jgi:hypothetical protein
MVLSLTIGAVIAVHYAGLVHWNTPGAQRISVVKIHIIATVREWQASWKNSKTF